MAHGTQTLVASQRTCAAGVANIMAYSWPSHCKRYLDAIEAEKRYLRSQQVSCCVCSAPCQSACLRPSICRAAPPAAMRAPSIAAATAVISAAMHPLSTLHVCLQPHNRGVTGSLDHTKAFPSPDGKANAHATLVRVGSTPHGRHQHHRRRALLLAPRMCLFHVSPP